MAENKDYIEGMRQLRQGSRTSPHEDQRTKRARSRADAKRAAVRDQKND